jgi:hypothetical protein
MAIPFHDLRSDDSNALAGYIRFIEEAEQRGIRGALFIVNARAEPVDFTFSRGDVAASFLWRPGEARRQAIASLAVALFSACSKTPVLLLARADEVHPQVFSEDVRIEIPLCRVAVGSNQDDQPTGETQLYWLDGQPATDSRARQLLDALGSRELLLEPFERAARGIDEAFAAP